MSVDVTSTTKLRHLATFKSSGTFTVPEGVTKVWVTVNGASGGGGGYNPPPNISGGAGGSAKIIGGWINVSPGGTYPVVVGAAGVGSSSNGNAGGVTYFDGTIVANGGGGGTYGGAAGSAGTESAETSLPTLYPTGADARITGYTVSNTLVAGGNQSYGSSVYSGGSGSSGVVQIFGV